MGKRIRGGRPDADLCERPPRRPAARPAEPRETLSLSSRARAGERAAPVTRSKGPPPSRPSYRRRAHRPGSWDPQPTLRPPCTQPLLLESNFIARFYPLENCIAKRRNVTVLDVRRNLIVFGTFFSLIWFQISFLDHYLLQRVVPQICSVQYCKDFFILFFSIFKKRVHCVIFLACSYMARNLALSGGGLGVAGHLIRVRERATSWALLSHAALLKQRIHKYFLFARYLIFFSPTDTGSAVALGVGGERRDE